MPYTGFHPALGERKGKHNRYVYISLAFSDWNWLLLSLSLVFPLLHSPCQHYNQTEMLGCSDEKPTSLWFHVTEHTQRILNWGSTSSIFRRMIKVDKTNSTVVIFCAFIKQICRHIIPKCSGLSVTWLHFQHVNLLLTSHQRNNMENWNKRSSLIPKNIK